MFLNSLEEAAWYHRWSFLNKDCVILAQQKPILYQTATPPQCVTLRTHKQKRHCVNRLSVGQCFIKIATVIYCICYMALGFVLTPHRPPSFADIFSCCSSLSLAANCCELPLFCLFVCLFVFFKSPACGSHTQHVIRTSRRHPVLLNSPLGWLSPPRVKTTMSPHPVFVPQIQNGRQMEDAENSLCCEQAVIKRWLTALILQERECRSDRFYTAAGPEQWWHHVSLFLIFLSSFAWTSVN